MDRFTTEKLTSFEAVGTSVDEINECFDKWAQLLRGVGVPANRTFVAGTLERTGLVRTRQRRPHSDTIYNTHEVMRVLNKASMKGPEFAWLKRLYRKNASNENRQVLSHEPFERVHEQEKAISA